MSWAHPNRLATSLAAVVLLGLCALLLIDVLARALAAPLFGSQEIAEMGMIVVVFAGLAELEAKGGQIRVDLLSEVLPAGVTCALDRASSGAAALLWGALAWSMISAAQLSDLLGLSSNLLALPRAPFQYLLAGAAGLAAVAALIRMGARHE